ncbi:Membrane protein containing HD superfamily hydrolase domain, YQFF ortholog [Candidatus Hydrogenisulfobacillus filiaventi]|uniref:Membrane protein containing HD superfamily hydrolase domain, YQFF ortholog n=1 Tax=Candidatus Hydrogenisulfobacillus filiaventi TaxID=2707344 RepID=A0A6F8ZI50_9FIRM|nr:HDIG domain-containing protein [Bacillota bacterium]CAB1129622.1 Membrane protein containing HD superfamily hydrolase domain, YQFF ortholog [Candidatus Hydrogenisulfobacillus filiaventi]
MKPIERGQAWWTAVRGQAPRWLETWKARQLLVAGAVWLAVTLIFSIALYAQRVQVRVGDLAPRNVYAPFGVVDWAATARARAAAARAVPDVYTTDPRVLTQVDQQAADDFSLIGAMAADSAVPLAEREAALARLIPIGIPPAVWGQVLSQPPAGLKRLQQDTLVVLASVMGNGNGVRNTPLGRDEAQAFASQLAGQEETDPGLRAFLAALSRQLVRPNMFLNRQVTRERRERAAAAVPVVKILKGEQVLVQGQRVTPADIAVLKELGLLDQGFDPAPFLGSAMLAGVLTAILGGYFWFFRRNVLQTRGLTIITGIITVLALIGSQTLSSVPALSDLVVPAAAIMVAELVDTGLGLVLAGVLALSIAVLTGAEANVALVSFVGGVAGVIGISRIAHRNDIILTGLVVGLVNLVTLAGLYIMEGAVLAQLEVWQELVWGLVDGVLAAVVAMGSIPFLEAPFGIITSIKLIELSNPNQPLLRHLLVEAPGTYHHSMVVGNLAEAATEAVGGNSLLARVGAYYHDIGKSKRPYFFVDNQFGAENPHDKLSPSLSALIIASHVRDGVELAKKHHLPDAIVDFIRQHHGTTLIKYFYEKARQLDTGEGVVEDDFRYEGPRPQSKETAIVMLADASEATARTLKHPTAQNIEQVVRRIIKDRLEDGQLDDSNLTLKELDIIARTFTRVLTGVFHQRIEYPEPVLKEMERSQGRGGVGGKPPRMVRRLGGRGPTGG